MQKRIQRLKRSDPAVIRLWVNAGGRCEFKGCNKYLMKDKKTDHDIFLADIAHIVAISKDGPRGNDKLPLNQRNNIENLMLLCLEHHRIVDNKELVAKYPKDALVDHKKQHEDRIQKLSNIKPGDLTKIIRLQGKIRADHIAISKEQMLDTILHESGRYQDGICEIDTTEMSEGSKYYWKTGKEIIDENIKRLFEPDLDGNKVQHVSIFSLARIPFLFYLGFKLGDKIETEIYQKHRDGNEGWFWEKNGKPVKFNLTEIKKGQKKEIFLLLSLSGRIRQDQIEKFDKIKGVVYEISPVALEPGRNIIKSKADLVDFIACYQKFLRLSEKNHAKEIHLFPAIPVSVAVACGRAQLKGVSPRIKIYDLNNKDKFKIAMEVRT
jgi:hypothetical protein